MQNIQPIVDEQDADKIYDELMNDFHFFVSALIMLIEKSSDSLDRPMAKLIYAVGLFDWAECPEHLADNVLTVGTEACIKKHYQDYLLNGRKLNFGIFEDIAFFIHVYKFKDTLGNADEIIQNNFNLAISALAEFVSTLTTEEYRLL